ncbi:MAG: flagellin lysine-N-methylase [Lachnospiraceae bacterium]|nr:flagellin lysine-N-methylase [Lachnospiraceae bacterium]
MAGYVLSLYPDFSCIADRCPSTCCSGWKITVDQESYQRFSQLTDEELRRDILKNLVEQDGNFRFANRRNGDCAMLDSDGLCRIQRNTQEEMLCNTCRKFPRITAKIPRQDSGTELSLYQETAQNRIIETARQDDIVWLSLAASCPVVAEYILDAGVSWLWLDESGRLHPLSRIQREKIWTITAMPVRDEWVTISWDAPALFDVFVDLALDVLGILVRFSEIPYLEHSFDLYDAEEPDFTVFGAFFAETGSSWHTFVQQYQWYRYPGRYLEFQEENVLERARQIQGELLLMRIMLCSRYVLRGNIDRKDWLEILHWVYRFSAHGQVMAEQVHALFASIKSEYLQIANQNICLKK